MIIKARQYVGGGLLSGAIAKSTKRICDPENWLLPQRLKRDLNALSLREFFLVRVVPVHCKKKTRVRKNYHLPPASFRSFDDSVALRRISRDRSRATAAL